jgi:flagellar assembly factor FliW
VEILKIMDVSNVVVYCIVVVPEEIVNMTANLKAPLLVNTENNQCKQVMMGNGDYEVKYKIFDKVGKKGGC